MGRCSASRMMCQCTTAFLMVHGRGMDWALQWPSIMGALTPRQDLMSSRGWSTLMYGSRRSHMEGPCWYLGNLSRRISSMIEKAFTLNRISPWLKKNISLGSIPADVFALIWCFMFQYHTLQTVNDLIYQSWCVPWCQILLNPEGLFHFTKHYLRIKALQMQPEVWLLLLMIYINIKVRLKPKCFCIIERKQNVWVPDSQFPGCLQKFNAPRFIVNYWKWSNTIIRYVANEQHVKYLSNWRYKLFTACTAAGTASYVLRDLCRELGGSHEEPLDDVCFPFPHIQEKYAEQNLTKHIVMFHEFMDWCIKLALDPNHLAADWHPKLEIIIVIRISCLTHHTVTLQDMRKCDESHEYYIWIGT